MTSVVYIAKNVYGGDGLGRLGDGRVVFVPGAWAGEQVKAEIVEEKRSFVKARLIEVVEASAQRIESGPSVPGMVYSSISFEGERAAKDAQLQEFFERARISVPDFTSEAPGDMLNYRNKVVYHFEKKSGNWVIGYRAEPSHEVVDVENDPLAVPQINAALPGIRAAVVRLLTQGAMSVRRDIEKQGSVTVRWTGKSGVKWWIGRSREGDVVKETTLGRDFEVPADGFYQVNSQMGEKLASAVVSKYNAVKDTAPELLDLYCGVGLFGILCKPSRLTGIESGRQAVQFAKKNAEKNLVQARFFAEEVGRNMRRISISPRTAVIVDPPRGGLERGVASWLSRSAAPYIFYVSCDPATLMRDLREICRSYDVESVRRFDMFPRTARFETLVTLKRKGL